MKPANSKTFRRKLGKRIRQIRKEQKISQSQLAFESGLSREQIYRAESGSKNMTIDTLLSIASAFEIPFVKLFDFEE